MKTFVFDNNYNLDRVPEVVSWYFLADSALTNCGKPFFIPDFAREFVAIPVIAIKINRLGKSVAPKFSERYFTEYAPAIHFHAKDLLARLKEKNLSADRAVSFDRSFIMGEFLPFPTENRVILKMGKNGKTVGEFDTDKLTLPIDEVLAHASYADTLKMGDLIVPALPKGVQIGIGDLVELKALDGDVPLLSVQIK